MDANCQTRCRLCLESSDDLVNIFDEFQDSTIDAILTKHFWFQVHKNDGLSELICQLCWTNTKTFHNFYKKVELILASNDWDSFGRDCDDSVPVETIGDVKTEESCVDLLTEEQTTSCVKNAPSDQDLYVVKCEEAEPTLEVIEIQISKHSRSDYNDDNNICDDESEPDDLRESNASDNQTLPSDVQCVSRSEEEFLDESHQSSTASRCEKDTAKEDAQIREFFSMVCEICSHQFETFMKAKNHYRIVHNTVGYLTCCGKKFLRRGRVLDHIYRHLNPDAYRCDPCGKRFADKFALKNHIENHEPFDSRAYKCGLCASSFTKASKLAQHERLRHCSNEDKKFHCDKCKKNFVSKSVLASHIRGVHEFAFAHVCDICARVFKSKHVFQNHIQEHSTTTRPKMQCNVCGAWLKHEESLRKHLKRHQDTFANCPICNKVLQNKHSLGNHIRSVHAERSHQCTLCDKAFKKAIVLKEHMALHTGQDLYKCPYCTKTFKSGANMHAHRKKSHFAEWTRDRSKRFTPTTVE